MPVLPDLGRTEYDDRVARAPTGGKMLASSLIALVLTLPMQAGGTFTDEPGRPIVLSWFHDGQKTPRFRVWQDGRIIVNLTADQYVTATADLANCEIGAVTCLQYTTKVTAIPAIVTPGTFQFLVSAFNEFGEVKGEPITIVLAWKSAPKMPRGLMLQKVELLPDGTWRIVK